MLRLRPLQDFVTPPGRRFSLAARAALAAPLGLWLPVHLYRSLFAHASLRTNAYDLSVFDYAIWNTWSGSPGLVPFMGHSLLSHHFMPSLLLAAPFYVWQASPVVLIVLQRLAVAAAAVLLFRLARRFSLPATVAGGLVTAFLFSRASHSAIASPFYVESFVPALVFGLLLAFMNRRPRWYWLLVVLALGCKEDVALYLMAFGALVALDARSRRTGLATAGLAAVWLVVALTVAIPAARSADGLAGWNPFVADRYGPADGTSVPGRLLSGQSAARVVSLTSGVGFLCWTAPQWLAVAAPGILLNLAARGDSLQAGLIGHYVWPILPWIYAAAAAGAGRILSRFGRRAAWLLGAGLVLLTAVDTPFRRPVRWPTDEPAAAARIREQLRTIPDNASVAAMPNLIPHLPHRRHLEAIGRRLPSGTPPDYVALSVTGDLWPLDDAGVRAEIAALRGNQEYGEILSGPLYLFRKRSAGSVSAR
jgi:hypothetical protein